MDSDCADRTMFAQVAVGQVVPESPQGSGMLVERMEAMVSVSEAVWTRSRTSGGWRPGWQRS